MPGPPVTTGFFGKIPAAGDFVSWNLPRAFTERWDRWMSRDLIEHPCRGPLDPRAWRFTVPAGTFCDAPCAGVWRMSEDRAGRRYPFVVAVVGAMPDPTDTWFDGARAVLDGAAAGRQRPDVVAGRIRALAPPPPCGQGGPLRFWLDDWEVQELEFPDIYDLAARGLREMRGPRQIPIES